jgi:hypothetical protein
MSQPRPNADQARVSRSCGTARRSPSILPTPVPGSKSRSAARSRRCQASIGPGAAPLRSCPRPSRRSELPLASGWSLRMRLPAPPRTQITNSFRTGELAAMSPTTCLIPSQRSMRRGAGRSMSRSRDGKGDPLISAVVDDRLGFRHWSEMMRLRGRLAAVLVMLALAGCAQETAGPAGVQSTAHPPDRTGDAPEHGGGDGGGGGGGM